MSNEFYDDIYFRLKLKGSYGDKFVCRFAVNTSFIKNNLSVFTKFSVDPCKISKNDKYSDQMNISIQWEDVCPTCTDPASRYLCQHCIEAT